MQAPLWLEVDYGVIDSAPFPVPFGYQNRGSMSSQTWPPMKDNGAAPCPQQLVAQAQAQTSSSFPPCLRADDWWLWQIDFMFGLHNRSRK